MTMNGGCVSGCLCSMNLRVRYRSEIVEYLVLINVTPCNF